MSSSKRPAGPQSTPCSRPCCAGTTTPSWAVLTRAWCGASPPATRPATCAILRREFELYRRPEFPFAIRGFHSDNGSEYINHTTANVLEKLRIEFTRSRARRSNDNALIETKNGAVVRKWMGYQFLPFQNTDAIHCFYCEWLNPYVNFHRPCAFASLRPDRRGGASVCPRRELGQGGVTNQT